MPEQVIFYKDPVFISLTAIAIVELSTFNSIFSLLTHGVAMTAIGVGRWKQTPLLKFRK